MPTTLRDVATAAGVSVTAASKVLHGRGESVRVSPQRADAIRAAAARLNYTPNALARNLRRGSTQTIGLLFEDFGSISAGPLYYVELLDGVAQAAFARHYRMAVLPELGGPDGVESLGDGRLDGVIWCKMPSDPHVLVRMARCPIPVVALNTPPPEMNQELSFVASDNAGGVYAMLDHLAELGHRRILFVMEEGEERTPDAVARAQAFQARVAASEGLSGEVAVWSKECYEFEAMWSQGRFSAVFAWNEGVGAKILERAREAGVAVPSQLSVAGFDSTKFCETTEPRLTAVRQPIFEMAKTAAEMLIDRLTGATTQPETRLFGCRLDVRSSTGPAPAGRRQSP